MFGAVQEPLPLQTLESEAAVPLQTGTLHTDPVYCGTQLHKFALTHVPCPEHTLLSVAAIPAHIGMLHTFPV